MRTLLERKFARLHCIALILLESTLYVASQGNSKSFYSTRYDIINIDNIMSNPRLLNNYVECLLDKKPCTPEGNDLKRILPEALRTSCRKCTSAQKSKALKAITNLYYGHPNIYIALAEKYDPTGKYTRVFENWFDERNAVNELVNDSSKDVKVVADSPLSDDTSESSTVSTTTITIPQVDRRRESDKPTTEGPTKISLILAAAMTTTQSTTVQVTSTRRPLRTTLSTIRPSTLTPTTAYNQPQQPQTQTQHVSLLNLFAKKPNGPISQSINRFVDTSQKVVKGVEQIVKSTFEIITGAAGVDTSQLRY